MPSHKLSVLLGTAATGVACGVVLFAAPSVSAAPPSDGNGYIDSTARCSSPAVAVVFGSTATSRVAVCRDSDGQYEYRGVRVSDGAKLILPASATGAGFVATNDGVAYTVTSSGLEVAAGSTVIRDEPMLDFHGDAASTPSAATTSTTATSTTPTSTTSTSTTSAPATSSTTTSTTVAPPIAPLPAEVGGSGRTG